MITLVLLLGASVLLALHAYWYYPYLSDDALISLRYAERLLSGEGLTWTDGRPVEGYSNLLWVLLVAGIGLFHIDLIDAVRILGLTCTIATFAAVLYALRDEKHAAPLTALTFLALSGPVAAWAVGGLEQPLVAALLGWSVALARPRLHGDIGHRPLSLLLGLLCVTRPDGPIFVVALITARCIASPRPSLSSLVRLLIFPVVFYVGQLAFRLFYYGEWVPNTALVKIYFTAHAVDFGWAYVISGLWSLAPFSLFALAAMLWLSLVRTTRALGLLLLCLTIPWLFYVTTIGGDIFPAWRHFVPMTVVFAIAVGLGVDRVLNHCRRRWAQAALGIGLALSCILYLNTQLHDIRNQVALRERWVWDGQVLGLVLKKAFGEQKPLYAVDNAGCLPYFSELPALDMLGLNDHYLARHPPPTFGTGILAHELGDGDYLWQRRPDLISFCLPDGSETSCFSGGKQLQALPDFHQQYSMVRFLGLHPYPLTAIVWVLKYSKKIGILDEGNRIEIPGFMFATQGSAAYLNKNGTLVTPVTVQWPAAVVLDRELTSEWVADIISTNSQGLVVEFQTPEPGKTRIVLSTTSEEIIEISGMVFEKIGG